MTGAQIDNAHPVRLLGVVKCEIAIACSHLVPRVTLRVAKLAANVVLLGSIEVAR